ncbi:MAG: hypothetical protein L3J03_09045 [Desulfobacterales bacterium]|nr:hypothetical protein [Desulfobacterales bacterium]
MIDIHCHILPEIDDGAMSIDESLEMAEQAVDNGIEEIVATPHAGNGVYLNNLEKTTRLVQYLNERIAEAGIPLRIYSGAENYLLPHLTDMINLGQAATLNNSRYILIELPPTLLLSSLKQELFTLQVNGYVPVLAHPERHGLLMKNTSTLAELVGLGCLCQVTAQSLTGDGGGTIQAAADRIVGKRLAQVIASDAHSATDRKPALKKAVKRAAGLLGSKAEAMKMVRETPAAMLANRVVRPAPLARMPYPQPRTLSLHKNALFSEVFSFFEPGRHQPRH